MIFKPVMRWDSQQKKLRLLRLVWSRGEWGMKTADGRCVPYSFKLTFGLRPALLSYRREVDQVRMTVLGVAVSYHWSAGGRFV
jgi:hypothetical protein